MTVLMADSALANDQISGALLICFENDRPLRGTMGFLDWRLNGHFSRLVQEQVLTGAQGEAIYAPLQWNGKTLHFVILGGGYLRHESERPKISRSLFESGIQKMEELGLTEIGIPLLDWNLDPNHPAILERGLCALH